MLSDSPLQRDLTERGKKKTTVDETAETTHGVSVKQEQELNGRRGMQHEIARTSDSNETTPAPVSVPRCEISCVEVHCDGEEHKQGPSEYDLVATSPLSLSQVNSNGPVCTEALNKQPDVKLRMKNEEIFRGSGSVHLNSLEVSASRPIPRYSPSPDSRKTQNSFQRKLSLPNTSVSSTADVAVFPSSLQSSVDPITSFDPTLVSTCSSYGSLASTEEHVERADPARPLSSGSGDSVYLDCRPSQDGSSSPSPQSPPTQTAAADNTLPREITSIPETKTDCKQSGNKERDETIALAKGDEADSAPVRDALLVAIGEATERLHSQGRLVSPVLDLRKESLFSEGSRIASPFSDTTADVSDFIGKEGEEEDEVREIACGCRVVHVMACVLRWRACSVRLSTSKLLNTPISCCYLLLRANSREMGRQFIAWY